MSTLIKDSFSRLDVSKSKTILLAGTWISALAIGLVAVAYAKLINALQTFFFDLFHQSPLIVSAAGPFLFVMATWLVRRFGPDAKGSGIPQVLAAIHISKNDPTRAWTSSLVSLRTAFIKILSSSLGILGGASIGREGPTVQIAASGFAWIGRRVRVFAPQLDFQSFVTAGAAAGVAAAFNTPIAGITFAIEELASNSFGSFKQITMLAIIVSGLTAQGLAGNYLYFGHPEILPVPTTILVLQCLTIGLAGGILGALFSRLLANPSLARMPRHWVWRAFIAGIICSTLGYLTAGDTSGSGYEVTERILSHGSMDDIHPLFPLYKFLTTAFSYLSGMAGGIFSPSLSMGAGVGLAAAKIFGWMNFKSCALLGMVGFFSGAVGAPLTAVIIVMEMTDERALVIPFMIAAYLAYSASRRILPVPLYHSLAQKHIEG